MFNKVILIEDDPVLRGSIMQTLELESLEVVATSSLTQARRSIRSNFRGVILSDIKMPDHNGFDVLKLSIDRDPDLPVILLTGHSDVPTAMRAIKEGAYDYLEKPCTPERLIDSLKRALNHRELVLESREMRQQITNYDLADPNKTLTERLELHERKIISTALAAENGKVAKAAERLGVPRNTLYDRMTKLKLVAKAYRNEE